MGKVLDGLPPPKMYCAELGRELVKSAIDDCLRKQSLIRDNKGG